MPPKAMIFLNEFAIELNFTTFKNPGFSVSNIRERIISLQP